MRILGIWTLLCWNFLRTDVLASYEAVECPSHDSHMTLKCAHGLIHLQSLIYGAHFSHDPHGHACHHVDGDCLQIETVNETSGKTHELNDFKKTCNGKASCTVLVHAAHIGHCWFQPYILSDYMSLRYDCIAPKVSPKYHVPTHNEITKAPEGSTTRVRTSSLRTTETTSSEPNNTGAYLQASKSEDQLNNLLALIILAAVAGLLLLILLLNVAVFYIMRRRREGRDEERIKLITESTQTEMTHNAISPPTNTAYDERFHDSDIYADIDVLPGPPPPKPPRSPGYGALEPTFIPEDEDEDPCYAVTVRPVAAAGSTSPSTEGNIDQQDGQGGADIPHEEVDGDLYAQVVKPDRRTEETTAQTAQKDSDVDKVAEKATGQAVHQDSDTDQEELPVPEKQMGQEQMEQTIPKIVIEGDLYAEVVKPETTEGTEQGS